MKYVTKEIQKQVEILSNLYQIKEDEAIEIMKNVLGFRESLRKDIEEIFEKVNNSNRQIEIDLDKVLFLPIDRVETNDEKVAIKFKNNTELIFNNAFLIENELEENKADKILCIELYKTENSIEAHLLIKAEEQLCYFTIKTDSIII